ncbi:putative hydrolase [Mycobacterium tuberculosis]|uniref:sulfatase-like hydrolase/transferase n=1 Tax=Mycobacterium tuberculosis TaxID=1773 RepID=UPI00061CB80B|nr:sulfatase-like hydrolase/transferase [Mycobacterium tuberculosis]CMR56884.1 putative hydrolase [Mycobacterium tuberculosis]
MANRPDIIIVMTDEERAVPPYESAEVLAWRQRSLTGRRWFDEHGISFTRHYTGSLACVPSRPTIFTGQYPDLHGVTQTDGIGKRFDDSRLRWLRAGEVPTLGNWFRAAGYDTHYDGKWHISHADLEDPATGAPLATNDNEGVVDSAAVRRYLDADPLGPYGFSGWVGPEPHGAGLANSGFRRDPLVADRVVAWLTERYARRRAGDTAAMRPFLLVASFVNPHDIVLFPAWVWRSPLKPSPLDPPHVPAAPTADEDLSTKPAAQVAYREAYYSGYGLTRMVSRNYARNAQRYRDLYYRLHAEVDGPIDRVRRAVTEGLLLSEDALRKAGSAGRATMFTDVAVRGDDGVIREHGEGEVVIKSDILLKEYWNRPEATRDAFDNGWFRTGDIGEIDDEGYLYIKDRLKDMIISGGENVYPAEIESVIIGVPGVSEVAVIGLPDEKWGEIAAAIVVADQNEVSEQQIVEYCGTRLARYKLPKKVIFAEAIPRNPTGKILKTVLREQYSATVPK